MQATGELCGSSNRVRSRVRVRDGRWVDVESRDLALPYRAVGPREVAVVTREITRDITGQVAVEQAVTETAERQANRESDVFLSRMNHDWRTPLNTVLGFAQLLELDELSEDQRDAVEHIRRAGEELLELINGAFDDTRSDRPEHALVEANDIAASPPSGP
jgi:signal transduction histidine kinase